MKETQNYQIQLPEDADTIDINILNKNFESIDGYIKALEVEYGYIKDYLFSGLEPHKGDLNDIVGDRIAYYCFSAVNAPQGYTEGIVRCYMTTQDTTGYNRHVYTQYFESADGSKRYERTYNSYGSVWSGWAEEA